jgi:uncharacterized protein
MYFDWDPLKAAANRRKHGITFEEASSIFYDANELSRHDETHSIDEDRTITIGMSYRLRVLIVVTTERDNDVIWIISARKANRTEVKRYEEAIKHSSRGG